jgi:hypothetical protein
MIEQHAVPASSIATGVGSRQKRRFTAAQRDVRNGGQTGLPTDDTRATAIDPLQAFHTADRIGF